MVLHVFQHSAYILAMLLYSDHRNSSCTKGIKRVVLDVLWPGHSAHPKASSMLGSKTLGPSMSNHFALWMAGVGERKLRKTSVGAKPTLASC